MIVIENLLYWLHFGPLRRPFRAFARRGLRGRGLVLSGPARGCFFNGAELAYRLGIYEIHVQRALARVLRKGSVLYDVGANIGFFTMLGAKLVGDSGAVVAFEPSKENCGALNTLCNRNNLRNVQVVCQAVSASEGDAYFAAGSSHPQGHLTAHGEAGSVKVRTVSLDGFAKSHPAPKVVLMDIEGAECEAMRGASELLSLPEPPSWIIEVHGGDSNGCVTSLLRGFDYSLTTLVPPVPRVGRYPIHLLARKNYGRA